MNKQSSVSNQKGSHRHILLWRQSLSIIDIQWQHIMLFPETFVSIPEITNSASRDCSGHFWMRTVYNITDIHMASLRYESCGALSYCSWFWMLCDRYHIQMASPRYVSGCDRWDCAFGGKSCCRFQCTDNGMVSPSNAPWDAALIGIAVQICLQSDTKWGDETQRIDELAWSQRTMWQKRWRPEDIFFWFGHPMYQKRTEHHIICDFRTFWFIPFIAKRTFKGLRLNQCAGTGRCARYRRRIRWRLFFWFWPRMFLVILMGIWVWIKSKRFHSDKWHNSCQFIGVSHWIVKCIPLIAIRTYKSISIVDINGWARYRTQRGGRASDCGLYSNLRRNSIVGTRERRNTERVCCLYWITWCHCTAIAG